MSQNYLKELLRGTIEPLLLFLIARLPMYGYQLIKELESRSHGYFKFTGSTVYSALRRLEREGLVLSTWQQVARNQERRYYTLTEKGRQFLGKKMGEWHSFHAAVDVIVASK